jgi:hypothetical protein
MAFGTYFNTDIGFGRANLDFIPTCASYIGAGIFRMNSLFHDIFNLPAINLFLPVRRNQICGVAATTDWENHFVGHIQWKKAYVN